LSAFASGHFFAILLPSKCQSRQSFPAFNLTAADSAASILKGEFASPLPEKISGRPI
jgi:hypothetical protein